MGAFARTDRSTPGLAEHSGGNAVPIGHFGIDTFFFRKIPLPGDLSTSQVVEAYKEASLLIPLGGRGGSSKVLQR